MKMRSKAAVTATAAILLAAVPMVQAQTDKQVGVTIYSSADPASFDPQQFISQQRMGFNPGFAWQVPGFAVVRDTRKLDLTAGLNLVKFTDVAEFIDPTTVSLVDLSVPAEQAQQAGLKVLEQKFAFDLVSPSKLLERYIDQPISVNHNLGSGKTEVITGTLLSANQGQIVLRTPQGLRLLPAHTDIQLGELPEGLITKPTLQWQLWAPAPGTRQVQTAYQTAGLTWRADYNLILAEDDRSADLGAWVTIMNLSGASYPDAQLKLIAGDVQRIQPPTPMAAPMMMRKSMLADEMAGASFEQKPFFEYHLYTLPRPATIDQNSTQQIALFETKRGVKVEKMLVYYGLPGDARWWVFPRPMMDRNLGQGGDKKVDVYIQFHNREADGLGVPLPKGKVRVFKADTPSLASGVEVKLDATGKPVGGAAALGSLEFVGEDLIDHTAKNEKVLVKIGQAFDVTGERVQSDFKVDNARMWMEETFRITLRNAKKEAQKVVVRENLYRWVNWQITQKSDEFEKVDARTVHFVVNVPAEGEKVVTYTVKYTW